MDKPTETGDIIPSDSEGDCPSSKSAPIEANDRTKGVLNSSLEKFLTLQKRREELSHLSQFKLEKIDQKQAEKAARQSRIKSSAESKTKLHTESKPEEKKWEEVRQYFDINAHLTGPVGHGIREPKSGLEEKINSAVKERNIDEAEKLSNNLSERELGVRINEAFGAKRYADAENVKKEFMMRKRQKRIAWGFETKERWQMKGNM